MGADNTSESGFRFPKPSKKRSASQQRRDLRRAAQHLSQRIEEARADRRVAWPEGQPEFAAERQEQRLADLHGEKRAMRRDIYREVPELEGRPVFKGQPGGRA